MSIVYLPEEEEDAQYVKKKVEEAGRKANLLRGDLRKRETCERAVEEHMKAFGKLNVLVNNGMFFAVSPLSMGRISRVTLQFFENNQSLALDYRRLSIECNLACEHLIKRKTRD